MKIVNLFFILLVFIMSTAMSFESDPIKDDIFMTNIVGPDSINVGDSVFFSFVGKYQRELVGSQIVELECNIYGPKNQLMSKTLTGVIVSQDMVFGECGYSTAFFNEPGTYKFEVVADFDNKILETKENNNIVSKTFIVNK